jgi:KDO2-lipid IV(A) lauroyltransferase
MPGVAKSLLVWYVFFPHVALLRLIGPWAAVVITRVICWLHWLFLLARGGGRVGTNMRRLAGPFPPGLSVATALRRYLETRHQFFVEWNIYPTVRGRRFVARTYRVIAGREHLDAALAGGRGAILLSHHFGLFRMALPALRAAGYQTHTLVLRGADYAGQAHDAVARAVMYRKVKVERASDLGVIYHRCGAAFGRMSAILQRNGILAIAADGMTGSHFVDVPYLGGRIVLPTGPAWLSLRSGAPILVTMTVLEGLARHRLTIHAPLYCQGRSRAAVEELVRAYAQILDRYSREYPWAWWSWRRMQLGQDADGVPRLAIDERAEETRTYYAPDFRPELEPA